MAFEAKQKKKSELRRKPTVTEFPEEFWPEEDEQRTEDSNDLSGSWSKDVFCRIRRILHKPQPSSSQTAVQSINSNSHMRRSKSSDDRPAAHRKQPRRIARLKTSTESEFKSLQQEQLGQRSPMMNSPVYEPNLNRPSPGADISFAAVVSGKAGNEETENKKYVSTTEFTPSSRDQSPHCPISSQSAYQLSATVYDQPIRKMTSTVAGDPKMLYSGYTPWQNVPRSAKISRLGQLTPAQAIALKRTWISMKRNRCQVVTVIERVMSNFAFRNMEVGKTFGMSDTEAPGSNPSLENDEQTQSASNGGRKNKRNASTVIMHAKFITAFLDDLIVNVDQSAVFAPILERFGRKHVWLHEQHNVKYGVFDEFGVLLAETFVRELPGMKQVRDAATAWRQLIASMCEMIGHGFEQERKQLRRMRNLPPQITTYYATQAKTNSATHRSRSNGPPRAVTMPTITVAQSAISSTQPDYQANHKMTGTTTHSENSPNTYSSDEGEFLTPVKLRTDSSAILAQKRQEKVAVRSISESNMMFSAVDID